MMNILSLITNIKSCVNRCITRITPYLTRLLIKYYLWSYQKYCRLRTIFFKLIKSIIFVYYYNGTTHKNITLGYYLGLNLKKYKSGTYYVKKYHLAGCDRFAFNGEIQDIRTHRPSTITDYKYQRKQFTLSNTTTNPSTIINKDLQILDNYYYNTSQFNDPVLKLNSIFHLMSIKCDQIIMISTRPFTKKIFDVKNMSIGDLYYSNRSDISSHTHSEPVLAHTHLKPEMSHTHLKPEMSHTHSEPVLDHTHSKHDPDMSPNYLIVMDHENMTKNHIKPELITISAFDDLDTVSDTLELDMVDALNTQHELESSSSTELMHEMNIIDILNTQNELDIVLVSDIDNSDTVSESDIDKLITASCHVAESCAELVDELDIASDHTNELDVASNHTNELDVASNHTNEIDLVSDHADTSNSESVDNLNMVLDHTDDSNPELVVVLDHVTVSNPELVVVSDHIDDSNPELVNELDIVSDHIAESNPELVVVPNHVAESNIEIVGFMSAKSIGESLTQTNLRAFHRAGTDKTVTGETTTVGLERIKELMSVTKNIKIHDTDHENESNIELVVVSDHIAESHPELVVVSNHVAESNTEMGGFIAAQSIGEPINQSNLRAFHRAGTGETTIGETTTGETTIGETTTGETTTGETTTGETTTGETTTRDDCVNDSNIELVTVSDHTNELDIQNKLSTDDTTSKKENICTDTIPDDTTEPYTRLVDKIDVISDTISMQNKLSTVDTTSKKIKKENIYVDAISDINLDTEFYKNIMNT